MDESPFAKLAPELRNRIYELVHHQPQGISIRHWIKKKRFTVSLGAERVQNLLTMTAVCRVVRRESTQLFYHINTFTFTDVSRSRPLYSWNIFRSTVNLPTGLAWTSCIVDIGRFRDTLITAFNAKEWLYTLDTLWELRTAPEATPLVLRMAFLYPCAGLERHCWRNTKILTLEIDSRALLDSCEAAVTKVRAMKESTADNKELKALAKIEDEVVSWKSRYDWSERTAAAIRRALDTSNSSFGGARRDGV